MPVDDPSLLRVNLEIRTARINDAYLLYNWRNDELTRQMSRNQHPVEWNDHIAWLNATFQNGNRKLLIALSNGDAVGTVRLDRLSGGDTWELSWTVSPPRRGRGYGTAVVAEVCRAMPSATFVAEIKAENAPSLQIAIKCGFKKTGESDGMTYWQRQLPP